MKRFLWYALFFIGLLLVVVVNYPVRDDARGGFARGVVRIERVGRGVVDFQAEFAESLEQRTLGLMKRDVLPEQHGMMFLFPGPQMVSMWMKETLISLDILFVAMDGRVVHIVEHAVPGSLEVIDSKYLVVAAFEVGAGTVEAYGIQVGDRLTYEK